jgi:hypothetical protein
LTAHERPATVALPSLAVGIVLADSAIVTFALRIAESIVNRVLFNAHLST